MSTRAIDEHEKSRPTKKPRLAPPEGFLTPIKKVGVQPPRSAPPRFTSAFNGTALSGKPQFKREITPVPVARPREPPASPAGPSRLSSLTPLRVAPKVSSLNTVPSDLLPHIRAPAPKVAIRPPPIPQPPLIPSKPLKVLKPPSLPQRTPRRPTPKFRLPSPPPLPAPSTPTKSFRTISSTTFARATDLSSDGGAAEIASIFLRDQIPSLEFSTPTRRHKIRGLEMSPEKDKKAKSGKFIRGGLAARANDMLTRTRNSLNLWQTETEHLLAGSRRPPPDIRLRILRVIHVPTPLPNHVLQSSPSSNATSAGIALCKIISTHSLPGLRASRLEVHRTVFSFLASTTPNTLVRNPKDFLEGLEVHVWAPYHQIESPSQDTNEVEMEGDKVVSNFVMMCSRFYILREPPNNV
ncbi:hypothetical protein BDN72DRAFT_839963 [Pluteus cervinus]|uniref:Uncharacterized protein n=1 Tax=Pluteus cervinus TaxID=181527 RepID=A0ACD3AVT3_9AGAR|nr:hypothetical protein BDN72DRAFT_839963 [Pluteus cervinus]